MGIVGAPIESTPYIGGTSNGLVYVDGSGNQKTDGVQWDTVSFTVTGNIVVTGAVDGRDLAVDGAKLDLIEASATADQTGAEIKALYEAEANAFTDAQFTKLAGVETGADVTDTANVTAAGALMDSEVDGDIKTLALPASTTITTFAQTFLDDTTQGAVQTTLGVDPAGTDNSTAVTLAGSLDYITIAGQVITRNPIVLTTDVSGILPEGNGGSGGAVFNTQVAATSSVTTNTAKITNATHTGEITGSSALTLDVTAISNQSLVTAVGADTVLIIDATDGALKKALASDLGGAAPVDSVNTQTGAVILDADDISDAATTNKYTTAADITKLAAIESSATADQTGAEIKALYEAEASAFTDAQFTKLAGVETGADVTDEANVSATASVIANTAKATNATHTGDVTGSTVLTIAAGAVDIAMLANGTDGELITWDAAGAPSTVAVGTATHVLTSNGPGVAPTFQAAAGGSGDVVGPASSTDDAIARFDLGTGELLQNSVGILTDAGALSGLTAITVPGAGATSELFGASAVASAGNTTSVGNAATSTGEGATAVGAATDATSTNSTAVGYASQATGATSTAVGAGSDALALDCTAIGANAQAITGIRATAVGSVADAPGALTVAIGYDATASVDNNVAIGGSSLASGATSTAIGTYSDATAANCVAIGYNAQNTGANSLVIGRSASSDQTQAVVLGNFASCTTNTAGIAIGYSVTVSGARSIVIGTSASATGNDSIAFGSSALGDGTNSTAIGANTDANDTNATAIGNVAQANAAGSTAIGTGTDATATDSTALGYLAQATATYSTSVGSSADAAYSYSVAIGYHSTTESANTCVIGGRDSAAKNVSDLYLGHGETSAHAGVTDSGIHATGGSGTDIGGTNLVIAGGRPTGSGTGGSVSFKTAAAGASGSTLRALVEHMEIREDGLILLPTIPETDPEVEYALYNDGGYLAISAGGMP